jgi:hypothetical protein
MTRRLASFAVALTIAAACVTDSADPTEAGPLADDRPPTAAEQSGKADSFVGGPDAWRRIWYARYYWQLHAPLEAAPWQPPFSGTRTVLLIPGTTIGPEFFGPMAARLRRDGFDPIIWAPADLFTDSLANGAARIAAKIEQVLAERGISKLSIVAECDGGVAARYYAEKWSGYRIDQLVTFVSAHHGSQAAPFGRLATGWPALRDIQPNSAFMADLNSTPLPAGLHMTSIYTCHDEFMWPYTTSWVDGATNVEFCDQWLGHFDGFWDANVYAKIVQTLSQSGI